MMTEFFNANNCHVVGSNSSHIMGEGMQVQTSQVSLLNSVMSVNHVDVAIYYLLVGVFSAVLGSSMSFLFRLQLSYPILLTSDLYNSLVTLHGLIMVFFAAMPTAIGFFANLLIPYHCNVPDLLFPRMNALSFWLLPGSLCMLVYSMACAGWTLYPPLSTQSMGVEHSVFSLHLAGISSLVSSCNFMVTMMSTRSQTWYSLSLFCWSILLVSLLLVMSLPVLAVGITLILTDKHLCTCFYDSSIGGDPVLYQHLFWFFGHPEVYVVILPVFGLFSMSLAHSSLHRLPGELSLVLAMLSIALIGSVVWAHHMYTSGMDIDTRSYFTAATMIIAVPTGIKVFTWLNSLLSTKRMTSYGLILVQCAFLTAFSIGGTSGIILSNASVDHYLHDTYYVVAHFHLVMALSLVYGILVGLMYSLSYLQISVSMSPLYSSSTALFIVSSLSVFSLMHYQGYSAMPRRYFMHSDTSSHALVTFCLLCTILSFALMLMEMLYSLACMRPNMVKTGVVN
uniref:Cytochrome c oxidase subunit 1 n=1 Tax=Dicyema koinonum TaxID=1393947 RepID=V9P5S7_9BILA|nr:cytochrome c oxidase subunit I [Dicyema koinonum]AGU60006.1 cytochrome c oxidase subunit I [Dicyema koinonum]AGU60008.1 cytochrome c oxidase subunit I [Dicyema koinonum]AGU60013.1 cytochrome c oxidase subunit I [Dicyema koinonum]AGU60014.1 cytochrome c oxidase subunit I [Dicyema koinonum]